MGSLRRRRLPWEGEGQREGTAAVEGGIRSNRAWVRRRVRMVQGEGEGEGRGGSSLGGRPRPVRGSTLVRRRLVLWGMDVRPRRHLNISSSSNLSRGTEARLASLCSSSSSNTKPTAPPRPLLNSRPTDRPHRLLSTLSNTNSTLLRPTRKRCLSSSNRPHRPSSSSSHCTNAPRSISNTPPPPLQGTVPRPRSWGSNRPRITNTHRPPSSASIPPSRPPRPLPLTPRSNRSPNRSRRSVILQEGTIKRPSLRNISWGSVARRACIPALPLLAIRRRGTRRRLVPMGRHLSSSRSSTSSPRRCSTSSSLLLKRKCSLRRV